MGNYFKKVHTIEELRKEYKSLLKKYHPDNPSGDVEVMQAIKAGNKHLINYDKFIDFLNGEV